MDTIPVCRVCLRTSLEYIDFETPFERYDTDYENESHDDGHSKPFTYLDCFRICTNLDVTNDFGGPQNLCDTCGMDLKITYDFLQKANKAHQILLDAWRLTKFEIVKSEEMDFEKSQKYLREDSISVKNYSSDGDPEQVETNTIQEISNYVINDNQELQVKQERLLFSEDDIECKSLSSLHQENEKMSKLIANVKKVVENTEEINKKDFVVKSSRTKPSPRRNDCQRPTKEKAIKSTELQIQEKEEKKELDCESCNKSFKNKIQFYRHLSRERNEQKLLCHVCSRYFRDARGLRLHEQTHQEKRERNFKCEHCGRKFFQQNNLKDHLKTHDHNREPTYKCDECSKSFYHRGSLTVHQQSHSGKGVECAACGKRYLRQIDLLVHLRGHSGDLPYKCSKCDKAFAQMGRLNAHLLRHDGYRYKCDLCGKDYLCQSTLAQHRKEHTGMPLKCSICDKEFAKLFKMRRHIQGVHKVASAEEAELLIIKVKTKKEYRNRMSMT